VVRERREDPDDLLATATWREQHMPAWFVPDAAAGLAAVPDRAVSDLAVA
jgi:hypothetical protein